MPRWKDVNIRHLIERLRQIDFADNDDRIVEFLRQPIEFGENFGFAAADHEQPRGRFFSMNDAPHFHDGVNAFVDDDARYMFDLPHEVRFVNAGEYGVNTPDMCLGFLSGMLTQNFDISVIFVDAFMKLVKVPADELKPFFDRLRVISEAHHVDFVISASVDDAVAPDFLREYFI